VPHPKAEETPTTQPAEPVKKPAEEQGLQPVEKEPKQEKKKPTTQPAKEPPLERLHPDTTYEKGSAKLSLESVRKMSTEEIIKSLKPGAESPLSVKPNGKIVQGNTRIKVLRERGVDVNSLPRTIHKPDNSETGKK
jgi:hypothetical protein